MEPTRTESGDQEKLLVTDRLGQLSQTCRSAADLAKE